MWKETLGVKIFKVFNYVFMALFAFATFYPFWYVLVASFNTGRDFSRGGVYFWPRAFTLENYAEAFKDSQIYTSLGISVARTLIGVVLGIFFTALVAYAFTVKTMPGRTFFTFFFYITTIISGGMIPKIDCCVEAVRRGVHRAHILDGRIPHSILIELFSDEGIGTMLY